MSARAPGRESALWASAFVLGGLVLAQAGRMPSARAEMASATAQGNYIVMTTDNTGEELLHVIDSDREVLLIYEVVNQRSVELLDSRPLPELFRSARARSEGRD